jgi:hypothetical protein
MVEKDVITQIEQVGIKDKKEETKEFSSLASYAPVSNGSQDRTDELRGSHKKEISIITYNSTQTCHFEDLGALTQLQKPEEPVEPPKREGLPPRNPSTSYNPMNTLSNRTH